MYTWHICMEQGVVFFFGGGGVAISSPKLYSQPFSFFLGGGVETSHGLKCRQVQFLRAENIPKPVVLDLNGFEWISPIPPK